VTASEESLSVAVAKREQAASDGSVNFTLKLVANVPGGLFAGVVLGLAVEKMGIEMYE
jgi:hypothetical protein